MTKETAREYYKDSMARIKEMEEKVETKEIITKNGSYFKDYFHFGANGDRAEITLHDIMKVNGFSVESDFYRHNENTTDLYLIINGKRVNFEIKTGGGIIIKAKTLRKMVLDDTDRVPENALLGVDYVVYCTFPAVINWDDKDDLLDSFYVIPRAEFLQFLIENMGKRKHSFKTATKFSLNQTAVNIQSNYLKQFDIALQSSDFPTLRTYLTDIGRLK